MDEKKLFNRICPKCGEACCLYEIVKVTLGSDTQINMSCENNHKWSEFYTLDYQGYWWDGKMYDSFGEEKKKEE